MYESYLSTYNFDDYNPSAWEDPLMAVLQDADVRDELTMNSEECRDEI